MGDRVPPSATLGDVLAARRRRRFVGRSAELELVRAALDSPRPPFLVLYLYGPGGIGKTSLLDEVADLAVGAGSVLVRLDGRDLVPAPAAVLASLAEHLDLDADRIATASGQRLVMVIDTYEALAPIDGWIRRDLLPRLPDSAVTVIAGRSPPSPQWRSDLAWGDLLRVVSMRNLAPRESVDYLRAVGVRDDLHDRLCRVAHGHPLALSLLADAVLRGGRADADPLSPDLVGTLLRRFVDEEPGTVHRRALEVCALARVTTESLLRDALGTGDDCAHDAFRWLRGLSFVETGADGLHPHDLARDVIDADLWWRDADSYADVFRRVWRHIHRTLDSATGRRQQQAIFDLKFVFRHLAGVLSPVQWESWGRYYPEPATAAEHAAIVELIRTAEGAESARLAQRWLDRQPDGFFVLRCPDGTVRGVIGLLDLTRASEEDRDRDPGAAAAWRAARRGTPVREGDVVTQTRFVVDRETYQDPSPTLNAVPILTMQRYLTTRGLAYDVLVLAEPDRWDDYFAVADLPRVDGGDFVVGPRRFGLFAHDFRRVPVGAWLERVTERALARGPSPPVPSAPVLLVLSQPEFAQSVKQGLHDLRQHALLARNPLLRTRLLHDRAGAGEPDVALLEQVLRDAVATLADHPRDDKLLRAVDRTYLRPAATQESAAAALGLPFSTYRRHLATGVERIVSWLWDQEVYGRRQ
ncbi:MULTISPECIES: AAA family ATPase [unclassified Rhodococcus (in: high G+C Gram-positive bacteria)]|uniref:AAA family ATPase n=1 Tax=unclassified Rhodococcus (in: high G+C Gram-positive bacteria) TaxID=192944 RepID=UPI000928527F|nr:ATP-binding protein [Rhodococcus sp. M8]OLL16740.1 ATP-binding protein [Rhodococcus sp. M8]QPG46817.1 ATP-binding protein [Rhodococcus sp. M8]